MFDVHEQLRLLWISGGAACFIMAGVIHYTEPNSWLPIKIVVTTLLANGFAFLMEVNI